MRAIDACRMVRGSAGICSADGGMRRTPVVGNRRAPRNLPLGSVPRRTEAEGFARSGDWISNPTTCKVSWRSALRVCGNWLSGRVVLVPARARGRRLYGAPASNQTSSASGGELLEVDEVLAAALIAQGEPGVRALGLLRDARRNLASTCLERPAEVAVSYLRGAVDALLGLPGAPVTVGLKPAAAGLLWRSDDGAADGGRGLRRSRRAHRGARRPGPGGLSRWLMLRARGE
ncbi:hypothetical protein BJY54_006983 [Streptomyces nodosus]|nr:hypothetical protein [Streptomyces nodosus]